MEEKVQCPNCNSVMRLRTAQKGRNAGKQFYGCSKYPHCRGTLSIEDYKSNENSQEISDEKEEKELFVFPHNMVARSTFRNYQSVFIQSTSTTLDLLEQIKDKFTNQNLIRAYSQWRLDFPVHNNIVAFTERNKQVISVCEKALTRGQVTLCSPYAEEEIKKLFNCKTNSLYLSNDCFMRKHRIPQDIWFDHSSESIFYYEVLPKVFKCDFAQWVIPQVDTSSLLSSIEGVSASGRVDFLIYHPSMGKPLIVEIDGKQHKETVKSDNVKRNHLRDNGYSIISFEAQDVLDRPDDIIIALNELIPNVEVTNKVRDAYLVTQACKMIHQIQNTLVQAIKYGYLRIESKWCIKIKISPHMGFDLSRIDSICRIAVDDLLIFLNQVFKLYSLPEIEVQPYLFVNSDEVNCEGDSICISFDDRITQEEDTFVIQNICLPFDLTKPITSTNAAVIDPPEESTLLYFLQYLFRKPFFWEGQLDAIIRALDCKDAIVLLPTGGGKSIAFQLAALLMPGHTIVIEPIISLIEDQLDNLANYGIDRCLSITSNIANYKTRNTVLNLFSQGEYLLLYIAPERLQMVGFRDALRALTQHSPINIVVIDEAHCVSEWGHDFRTSYLNIGRISREYCKSQGIVPPLIALTGTASRAVLKDVQRELQIEDFDAIITPKSFDRSELKFTIVPCKSSEKFPRLKGYLGRSLPDRFNVTESLLRQVNGKDTFCGLVFCPWVNGEFGVVKVSNRIQAELSIPNHYYSGKAPKYEDSPRRWNTKKQYVTKAFKNNKTPLLTCTKAFGMGIDKPNIRYTVHYGLPFSIEAFYQEAGRAGRDGNIAHCSILASIDDQDRARVLLNPDTSVEDIKEAIENMHRKDNDDITRALYFHVQSFKGVDAEMHQIKNILNGDLTDYMVKGSAEIVFKTGDSEEDKKYSKEVIEKAIHRLLLLGIINDYTVNYTSNTFIVIKTGASKEEIVNSFEKYVAGYLKSKSKNEVEKAYALMDLEHKHFVIGISKLLLNFIYNVIEKGRRRALYEIYLTVSDQATDESIRQRILNYLQETEHSKLLDNIVNDQDAGLDMIFDILEDISSPNDAAEIRGQASRYLESYPDYPSMLMIRAVSEIYTKDRDTEVVKQNFNAAIHSAKSKYNLDEGLLYNFISRSLVLIGQQSHSVATEILEVHMREFEGPNFAKAMVKEMPLELAVQPALYLLIELHDKCITLLQIEE